jgi:hypothetical protein
MASARVFTASAAEYAWSARVLAAAARWSAAPAFWSTSPMRPSLTRVRSWFSSTERVNVSTLSLTSPTLVRTNFFVAQAVVPLSGSARTGTTTTNFFVIAIASVC